MANSTFRYFSEKSITSFHKIRPAYSHFLRYTLNLESRVRLNDSSVLNHFCVVTIVAISRAVIALWLMLVLSRGCLFVCLCCLVATSRRSVVCQQWRPGTEDRQSKQKLEIRRMKPKISEQLYTGNKGKCRHPLIILYLWTLNTFTFYCMCLNTTNPKDMSSPLLFSLYTWVYTWVV